MSAGPSGQFSERFCALSNKALFLRLIFATCSILVAAGLSFRAIPSVTDSNDTGRYVANQMQACALPAFGGTSVNHDSSLVIHSSWGPLIASSEPSATYPLRAFNLLMRPACLTGEPRFFLFCTAMAFPIAILLFANWNREGTLLLAGGILLSTIGFEFMTNALRQGVGLSFLLAAIYFQRRSLKIVALVSAVLMHDSNWFFAPLAILLAFKAGVFTKRMILRWSIPTLAAVAYIFALRFLSRFEEPLSAFSSYTKSYADESSVPFLLYMISPIALIFVIRCVDRKAKPSSDERITFWYSAVILALSLVFLPASTYRFAMAVIPLQVFFAMRSPNLSLRSAGSIACALFVHFMIYAYFAKSVVALFYG
jgi:hypothetical protein